MAAKLANLPAKMHVIEFLLTPLRDAQMLSSHPLLSTRENPLNTQETKEDDADTRMLSDSGFRSYVKEGKAVTTMQLLSKSQKHIL
nr:hypothetical protein [Tanacetum cinerariifolium]